MTHSGLTSEVQDFLAKHIHSVEQLEVLLLLYGNPNREWSAEAVSQELRIPAASASERLDNLCALNLLDVRTASDVVFKFNPRDGKLLQAVRALSEAYRTHRVAVITAIFTKPSEPLRDFANAFRLKKDK